MFFQSCVNDSFGVYISKEKKFIARYFVILNKSLAKNLSQNYHKLRATWRNPPNHKRCYM